ncbi:MAG: hypothetical protein HDT42_03170 [Ruminococcaceae bacterium]|nr:hypothetical protein [Oscillospiraceae bacterium]
MIESEIGCNLAQREAESDQRETAASRAFEGSSGDESEDMGDEPDESDDQGIPMEM